MTYSIGYKDPTADGPCAADWDFKTPGKWSYSERNFSGSQWYSTEGLNELAYQAILKHFGLEDYVEEVPLEKVISMSPDELRATGKETLKISRRLIKVIKKLHLTILRQKISQLLTGLRYIFPERTKEKVDKGDKETVFIIPSTESKPVINTVKICFHEKRVNGMPDSKTYFDIPIEGKLPVMPYKWDGTKYRIAGHMIYSPEERIEITWCSETIQGISITWIEERQEWIAYKIIHTQERTDAYGFYDEYYSFEGPWSLDDSHKKALLVAFNAIDKFDISKAHTLPFTDLVNSLF